MSDPRPQVVVFTGGTSGVGLETIKALLALPLPRRPWHIIVGTRSPYPSFKELPRSLKDDVVRDFRLDLCSYESVRLFVREIAASGVLDSGIDYIVLCAGVICASARLTGDGQEETLQVNALSQALLLDLLWPRLCDEWRSRVVFVASALHLKASRDGRIRPTSLDLYALRRGWKQMDAYGDSKLLLMHIFFLASRRADRSNSRDAQNGTISVVSVSPGFIPKTRLVRELPFWRRLVMTYLVPLLPFARTPAQGGALVAKAVLDFGLPSGVYLSRKGEVPAAKECYDIQLQKEWEEILRERKVWLQSQSEIPGTTS